MYIIVISKNKNIFCEVEYLNVEYLTFKFNRLKGF